MSKYSLVDLMPVSSDMGLIHPTLGNLEVSWKIVGWDSQEFKDASKRIAQRRLDTDATKVSISDMEDDNMELLASCVVGWSDSEMFGEFSHQAAKAHLLNPGLSWIREQLEQFIRERSNFFRKPS